MILTGMFVRAVPFGQVGKNAKPHITVSYICWDRDQYKYVRFYPSTDLTFEEIFSMFKRFEVVMGTDINEVEVNEDDTLDLK